MCAAEERLFSSSHIPRRMYNMLPFKIQDSIDQKAVSQFSVNPNAKSTSIANSKQKWLLSSDWEAFAPALPDSCF